MDVGCGTGQTVAYLAQSYGVDVSGIDVSATMVEKARFRLCQQQLNATILQGTAENIPFPNNHFDLILCESVLSFTNKQKTLDEIFRLLKPGARLLATEHTLNTPLQADDEQEIKQFYGLEALLLENDWRTLFRQAGFHDIQITDNLDVHTEPDFHYSPTIDPALYEVMKRHLYLITKYQGTFSYRVYTCKKSAFAPS